jgi:hypothetical protein
MSFGRELSRQLLNEIFGKAPEYTAPANYFVSLHTGDPGEDGQGGNEATGTGYARAQTAAADWNAATLADPSLLDNANAITFAQAGGDWSGGVDFTHAGLWRTLAGATEADYLGSALLGTPKPVLNGDTPEFAAGALDFTLD